jgi:hypothetical protein
MSTSKKSKFLLSSMVDPAEDAVRKEFGSYWEVDPDGKFQRGTSSFAEGKFTSAKWGPVSYDRSTEAPYYSTNQVVTLLTDSNHFNSFQDFRNYILGAPPILGERAAIAPLIVTGTVFSDATIDLGIPYSLPESKALQNVPKQEIYQTSPNYNFFSKVYETQTLTAPEYLLPDLYVVYSASLAPDTQAPLRDLKSEINNYVRGLPAPTAQPLASTTEVLPIENIKFLNDASSKKTSFPMYNEISFPTQITTRFAEILKDAEMSTEFLNFIATTTPQAFSFTGFREELSVSADGTVTFVSPNGQGDFNTYDVFTWWKNTLKEFSEDANTTQRSPIPSPPPATIGPTPQEINKFSKFLHLLTFEGKMQELVNNYLRTYVDILKGSPGYSETVAYKIEKRQSGRLISTFIFPNSNEIDVYNFIDTQVKYSQTYQYQAFAYQLVLGSEYEYSNVILSDDGEIDASNSDENVNISALLSNLG